VSALRLFVTGTDTGVGKTRIATTLCHAFGAPGGSAGHRVAAMKPVASGCMRTAAGLRNEDATALLEAMNVRASYGDVNPYAFEPAIAPHIAAQEAGCRIELEVLDHCFERLERRSDIVVVEGAGGWLAPLDAERTFADLAARWELDVVLVVGLRLGCLNHALLTAESIQRRGLRLRGWVANSVDARFERREANLEALRARMPAACIGEFPHAERWDAAVIPPELLAGLRELAPKPTR
jgi:dethiobiotin synthetase